MTFKQWLEWEGNRFDQETDLVNGPAYPNSKYKGPGDPEVNKTTKSKDIGKKFGFSKYDDLLKFKK